MSAPADVVAAGGSVAQAAGVLLETRHAAAPAVTPDGVATGIVTAAEVAAVPPADRAGTPLATLLHAEPELRIAPAGDVADLLDEPPSPASAARRRRRAGRPLGVLSITDVRRALDARRMLAS